MPECGFCKDCKWWQTEIHDTIRDGETVSTSTHHYCQLFDSTAPKPPIEVKAGISVVSYGREALYTDPDFGCVHFGPKS